jgi:hypothetical protein
LKSQLKKTARVIAGATLALAGFAFATSTTTSALAGTTTSPAASVTVGSSITLTGPGNFNLGTALPGATAGPTSTSNITVTTNNLLGYTVSVLAANADFTGSAGNTDTFASSNLQVNSVAVPLVYTPLSTTVPTIVKIQATPSAAGGDTFTHSYKIPVVPSVNADTYSTTVNYTAAAN